MTQAAPLMCGVPVAEAQVLCVFVHGRGQSPEVMQEDVIRHLRCPGVAYALPRAPGGAWYTARAVDALTDATRAELAASLAQVTKVISLVKAQSSAPLLLAGFSQGACLLLEYTFAKGPWAGALAAFTGCRVGQVGDDRPAATLAGLSAYLTGSDADPWIPVTAFAEAAGALGAAGARLRADVFPGRAHQVSPPEIAMLDAMLADLAAGRPSGWDAQP